SIHISTPACRYTLPHHPADALPLRTTPTNSPPSPQSVLLLHAGDEDSHLLELADHHDLGIGVNGTGDRPARRVPRVVLKGCHARSSPFRSKLRLLGLLSLLGLLGLRTNHQIDGLADQVDQVDQAD